jgi:hypothetical protein
MRLAFSSGKKQVNLGGTTISLVVPDATLGCVWGFFISGYNPTIV